MCFVIAGVQPKTKVLDQTPQRCPSCGLHQAVTQQVDHYFSLFFIPLVRLKQGRPFLYCRRCQGAVDAAGTAGPTPMPSNAPSTCRRCGGAVEPLFNYCPHCGKHLE